MHFVSGICPTYFPLERVLIPPLWARALSTVSSDGDVPHGVEVPPADEPHSSCVKLYKCRCCQNNYKKDYSMLN